MSKEVKVTLKAYDETSAAFASVEKRLDKLVKSAEKAGTGIFGIFAADRLGKFIKDSAKAAAEADEHFAATFKRLDDSVYNLQVNVGKALLGNSGVVWAFGQVIGVLNELAIAITKPAAAGTYVWQKFIGGLMVDIGNLRSLIGNTFGDEVAQNAGALMQQRGMHMQSTAQKTWDNLVGSSSGLTRPPEGNKSQGSGGGWTGFLVENANKNLFGSLGKDKSYATNFLPTVDEFEESLKETLNLLDKRLPRFLEDLQFMHDLEIQFTQQVAGVFGDAIGAGIEAALDSGSVTEGFKALAGGLVGGFGVAVEQFGQASLAFAILQKGILDNIMSLFPGGAIVKAVSMIALGKVLQVAARKAFSPQSNYATGGGGGATAGSIGGNAEATSTQGVVAVTLPREGYIDSRNPFFQQFLVDTMALAAGRRLEFR